VFPNPVPPGYGGTIAIRGLANDAYVKITESDGRLVFQTRALGGQAVWDGRNYKGEKISSGVYLVLAADEVNKEKVVTKIFFIR
jgi:flagellar hook assembly protein FlgD